jgi:prepilin-type N-terminal cleavage/methylation domain-containing protein
MRRDAGLTLLEVLIAVGLLSVLSVGMMLAMRLGITALAKTDARLMDNRRIAGAQRIVEQQLEGLIPVVAPCLAGQEDGPRVPIFSGQENGLTMVSAFSLQEAWRGRPQILQFFVIPGEEGGGVRLVVNEIPYTGSRFAGSICAGPQAAPDGSGIVGNFRPPQAGSSTFVLADRLRRVSFQYLKRAEKADEPGTWMPAWLRPEWPAAIRIIIEPAEPSPARLQPVTVTAPVFVNRDPKVQYADR